MKMYHLSVICLEFYIFVIPEKPNAQHIINETIMKKIQLLTLVILCILCGTQTMATGPKQKSFNYSDSWGKAGFNLVSSNAGAVNVIYSVTEFQITDELINGKTM